MYLLVDFEDTIPLVGRFLRGDGLRTKGQHPPFPLLHGKKLSRIKQGVEVLAIHPGVGLRDTLFLLFKWLRPEHKASNSVQGREQALIFDPARQHRQGPIFPEILALPESADNPGHRRLR